VEASVSESYDLIVIGGGPAGASAAITAARQGCRVLLLERGRYPRHKVCGEFVSAESLELLTWLLGDAEQDLLHNSIPLSESRLLLDGRSVRIPVMPSAASIARHDLDLALWNAAQRAGVTTLDETSVRGIEGQHPFRVQTAASEFQGRAVINASGRWSNLNRAGSQANGSRWLGLKAHFHGETEPGVDLYFFKGGYCGVQPVRAPNGEVRVNVCALFQTNERTSWDDLFSRHPLLEARARHWTAAFSPLSTFPVTFSTPRPVSDYIFNAGDAASFVDPFVGDGIALALRSGNLAARRAISFLRGLSDLKPALQLYEDDYRRRLRPVYQISSLLRKFLVLPRGLRAPFLAACERSPRIAHYLVQTTRSRGAEVN
jgi:flavin-dependent dehydrogenase